MKHSHAPLQMFQPACCLPNRKPRSLSKRTANSGAAPELEEYECRRWESPVQADSTRSSALQSPARGPFVSDSWKDSGALNCFRLAQRALGEEKTWCNILSYTTLGTLCESLTSRTVAHVGSSVVESISFCPWPPSSARKRAEVRTLVQAFHLPGRFLHQSMSDERTIVDVFNCNILRPMSVCTERHRILGR
jgi:hypothetical protein